MIPFYIAGTYGDGDPVIEWCVEQDSPAIVMRKRMWATDDWTEVERLNLPMGSLTGLLNALAHAYPGQAALTAEYLARCGPRRDMTHAA